MAYKENMTQEEYNNDMAATRNSVKSKYKDYDQIKTEYQELKFKETDRTIKDEFTKLNGVRYDDFKKIAGITYDTDINEVKKTIQAYRKNDEYKFLFKNDDKPPIDILDPKSGKKSYKPTWIHRK